MQDRLLACSLSIFKMLEPRASFREMNNSKRREMLHTSSSSSSAIILDMSFRFQPARCFDIPTQTRQHSLSIQLSQDPLFGPSLQAPSSLEPSICPCNMCSNSSLAMCNHQSTAQPFSCKNSSQAALSARLGRKSETCSGSRVRGSVGERRRCSIIEERS